MVINFLMNVDIQYLVLNDEEVQHKNTLDNQYHKVYIHKYMLQFLANLIQTKNIVLSNVQPSIEIYEYLVFEKEIINQLT
jgi:hypothetical protein